MEKLETEILNNDAAGITRAAEMLNIGLLVAFPTETVYGLGANAADNLAVARIFAAKNRPTFNPLIVHVGSLEQARGLADFDDQALVLAAAFWPGPLTLVLPLKKDSGLADLVTAGLPTVALRVPRHPLARALLNSAGFPLAAPSANPSGRISPTTAAHVVQGLGGRISGILDGGPCSVGLESTIVGFSPEPTLMRPGGLPADAIEKCLGHPLAALRQSNMPNAPGQLASHYAPAGALRLNAEHAQQNEVLLGFGPMTCDLNLSVSGDLIEAAANLFGALHNLDQRGTKKIAVATIPNRGLGVAINDRLKRAAAPRL